MCDTVPPMAASAASSSPVGATGLCIYSPPSGCSIKTPLQRNSWLSGRVREVNVTAQVFQDVQQVLGSTLKTPGGKFTANTIP